MNGNQQQARWWIDPEKPQPCSELDRDLAEGGPDVDARMASLIQ